MSENKITTYLLYAVGEIILVVVGILIAVQIDDWNKQRERQSNISSYLMNLKTEMEGNKSLLESTITKSDGVLGASRALANNISQKTKSSSKEISTLLYRAFAPVLEYHANQAVLNEMIASGAIRNIENDSLKGMLFGFQSSLRDLQIQESYHTRDLNTCTDFLLENGSFRTVMDETGASNFLQVLPSESLAGNDILLESRVFENTLLLFIASGTGLHEANYLPFLEEIDKLLVAIDHEIQK